MLRLVPRMSFAARLPFAVATPSSLITKRLLSTTNVVAEQAARARNARMLIGTAAGVGVIGLGLYGGRIIPLV